MGINIWVGGDIFPMNPLEQYLKRKSMTKTELAQRCGVSVYVINKLLTGKNNIKSDALMKICNVTNMTANEVLGLPAPKLKNRMGGNIFFD